MNRRMIRFGVIGCGLMGKEFASAVSRWCHLADMGAQPVITAVCDANPAALQWFTDHVPSVKYAYTDYREMLSNSEIEAIYCAVPHNLHERIYIDIIESGKHLLGEKPFGIDIEANRAIMEAVKRNPHVLVRCSSEFPFFPGAYQLAEWVREERFGKIIQVEAGFWHSSDLDRNKPMNWKRKIATNGEYGCMGDLGLHVLHLPLRFGWRPSNVRSLLNKVYGQRPDSQGRLTDCETWDNATLACEVNSGESGAFPMLLSMKRIAPGHANTWFLSIQGTDFSAEFSTKDPKRVASMPYASGGAQAWHVADVPYKSAYDTITGGIFEFGFSDSILQMWAAFCDEIAHGQTSQPLYCATPEEAADSHLVFTAALESNRTGQTVTPAWGD